MKKVILAENSAILKSYLKEILENSGLFQIVKMTANGEEVLRANEQDNIDLIILGEGISLIDEAETTRFIMETKPVPVVVFSNDLNSVIARKAAENGAVVIPKPDFDKLQDDAYIKQLIENISQSAVKKSESKSILNSLKDKYKNIVSPSQSDKGHLIVFGASTGGPQTLQYIFNEMPADFPIGIALVQHFEQGFEAGFATWLNSTSPLNIRIAKDKDFPQPGEVIIAPQQKHMKADGNSLILQDGPKVNNQKPAVDVLFSTAAPLYKDKLIGVLLTGMGRDGANGCLDIVNNGGFTIVQDQQSSIVYGMPKEAAMLNAASVIMAYQKIPAYLTALAKKLSGGKN